MTKRHAMIDLETLSLGPDAPIMEIGLCLFDDYDIINVTKMPIDLLDVVLTTRFVPSVDTIDWWNAQKYNPRSAGPRMTLKGALSELNVLCKEVQFVWANSPAFDLVILGQHYKKAGIEPFWNHRMEMCYRTVRSLYKILRPEQTLASSVAGTEHDSAYDAQYQAEMLIMMRKELNLV